MPYNMTMQIMAGLLLVGFFVIWLLGLSMKTSHQGMMKWMMMGIRRA